MFVVLLILIEAYHVLGKSALLCPLEVISALRAPLTGHKVRVSTAPHSSIVRVNVLAICDPLNGELNLPGGRYKA